MAVVNPYLKKKPATLTSTSTAQSKLNKSQNARSLVSSTAMKMKPKDLSTKFEGIGNAAPTKRASAASQGANIERKNNASQVKMRSMIKAAVTPSPPHKTIAKTSTGATFSTPSTMSSTMAKKSKGKTKSAAVNLKSQLRREIAMLKKQKAQRILAKKQEKERAIKEEKRKERERLLAKEMQERRERQEILQKNRERKIQDQKDKLMKSLCKDRTGNNSVGASAGTGVKQRKDILPNYAAVSGEKVASINIDTATSKYSESGSRDRLPHPASSSPPAQTSAFVNANRNNSSESSSLPVPSRPTDQRNIAVSMTTIGKVQKQSTQPLGGQTVTPMNRQCVPMPLTMKTSTDGNVISITNGDENLGYGIPSKTNQNVPTPTNTGVAASQVYGVVHPVTNVHHPVYPNQYHYPSQFSHNSQYPLIVNNHAIVPPSQPVPNAPLMMDPRYNHILPYYSNIYSIFPNQYYQMQQSTAMHFAGHSSIPNKPLPSTQPRARPRARNTISVKDMIIHKDPLLPPSPFVKTHCAVSLPIIIRKKDIGTSSGEKSSFGVELKYERKGALVEIGSSEENAKSIGDGEHSGHECARKVATNQAQREKEGEKNISPSGSTTNKESSLTHGTCQDSSKDGKDTILISDQNENINVVSNVSVPPGNGITCTKSSPVCAPNNNSREAEQIVSHQALTLAQTSAATTTGILIQKNVKPKRKRVSFGVMMVKSASKQNDRAKEGTQQHEMLQSGDIILSVNGQSVSGLTFMEATSLFGKSKQRANINSRDDYEFIECTLTIAREKKVTKILEKLEKLAHRSTTVVKCADVTKKALASPSQKPSSAKELEESSALSMTTNIRNDPLAMPTKIPFLVDEYTGKVISGEFSPHELHALVNGMRGANAEYGESSFVEILTDPIYRQKLIHRNSTDLQRKWVHGTQVFETKISKIAMENWRKEWKAEQDISEVGSRGADINEGFVTPSQRSALRSAPRPSRGCKCGSLDHSYVNDEKCLLYRNLRSLATCDHITTGPSLLNANNVKGTIDNVRNLRKKKIQEEEEADIKEAMFVHQMEVLQVSRFKVAVFAPRHLCILLLSAIASFADDHGVLIKGKCGINLRDGNWDRNEDSDSDEEDIPLLSLGKKRTFSGSRATERRIHKRRRLDHLPNLFCLAKLILHISKTWGHLFSGPEESESAWVKHCYEKGYKDLEVSDNILEGSAPFSEHLPFESLHYYLDRAILSRLQQDVIAPLSTTCSNDVLAVQNMQDAFLITHLSSCFRTGIEQEIKSLVSNGVISITKNGFLTLSEMWQKNIPPFVLYDMWDQAWGKEHDHDNKFCIHPIIRDSLSDRYWKRTDDGWTYMGESQRMHINHAEYLKLKKSFEDKYDDRRNEDVGIAQFGI